MALFALGFGGAADELIEAGREVGEFGVDDFGEGLLKLYEAHATEVDGQIEGKLKGWRVERIQKVSLALLRLSIAEMLFGGGDMDSVIINEAVELAKKYGNEQDYQFVNGVLGSVSRQKAPEGDASC